MELPLIGYSTVDVPTPIFRINSLQAQNSGLSRLSGWEWLFILIITIIIVWLLIVIQARSQSNHEFGSELVSADPHEESTHVGNAMYAEETESRSFE
jgi:hypothetical protein